MGAISGIGPLISIGLNLAVPIVGNLVNYHEAQTQDLNISDQLKNGIRYFDVRLHLDSKEGPLYLAHDRMSCYDSNYNDYLYFNYVLKYCIKFLIDHESETIIIHLKKKERLKDETYPNESIAILIENIGMEYYDNYLNIKYKDYFFIPENDDS